MFKIGGVTKISRLSAQIQK